MSEIAKIQEVIGKNNSTIERVKTEAKSDKNDRHIRFVQEHNEHLQKLLSALESGDKELIVSAQDSLTSFVKVVTTMMVIGGL